MWKNALTNPIHIYHVDVIRSQDGPYFRVTFSLSLNFCIFLQSIIKWLDRFHSLLD